MRTVQELLSTLIGTAPTDPGRIGEVDANPTANTVLGRLKELLTGIVLKAGSAIIGKVGIDQTTPGTTDHVSPIAGQNGIAGGTGVDGVTVPRVTLATNVGLPAGSSVIGKVGMDQTTPGTTDHVSPIAGQNGIAGGTGVDGVTVPRVTLATNVGLPAGTNLLGKVGVDQTTPGATNKVVSDPVTATPTSYNITCAVADTEYSQVLPSGCRHFEFQARTEAVVRYAFVTGKVAGPTAPYHTLKAGDYYFSPALNQGATPSTLFIASPIAGTVLELIVWT